MPHFFEFCFVMICIWAAYDWLGGSLIWAVYMRLGRSLIKAIDSYWFCKICAKKKLYIEESCKYMHGHNIRKLWYYQWFNLFPKLWLYSIIRFEVFTHAINIYLKKLKFMFDIILINTVYSLWDMIYIIMCKYTC